MKLLMLKGLPASGKSTYANKLAESGYVRVNKDDIRVMLHAGKWSGDNEKQVLRVRDFIIKDSLKEGKSVVVDDTNFEDKHRLRLRDIAGEFDDCTFETKFFEITPEEAIKRDLKRPNSVGSDVIMKMWKKYLAPKPNVYVPPKGKPNAIIVDIDGTLAHIREHDPRSPYDWHRVEEDEFDQVIGDLVDDYSETVILVSGRDEVCRPQTEAWLAEHDVLYDELFMRPKGDMRKDVLVKLEIWTDKIKDNYQIDFVLDDRNQVVEMWRRLGLKVLQVAEGDF